MNQGSKFAVFVVVWALLGVAGSSLFWGARGPQHAAFKRRWFAVFVIGTGTLFIVFTLWIQQSFSFLVFLLPAVAAISFLNLRMTKFCDSCGATSIARLGFAAPRFCSRCGAQLP